MRILFIEDDREIAETLTEALSWHFAVDNAYTGAGALEMLFRNVYDLVILDYTLPDIGGPALYEQIRAVDGGVKVLVLTGNGATEAKVRMLDAGADDYVTKPFHLNELMARIRAILRRGGATGGAPKLAVTDLELDAVAHTVLRRGVEIKLRRKEFDILAYLMRNHGRVVTRAMLLEHVWEGHRAETNVVDVHIKTLRDLIDRPYNTSYIQTIAGVGYKLDTWRARPEVKSTKEGGDDE